MSILAWIAACGSQLSSEVEMGKIIFFALLVHRHARSSRHRIFACCVALTPLRVGLRSQTGASEGLLGYETLARPRGRRLGLDSP